MTHRSRPVLLLNFRFVDLNLFFENLETDEVDCTHSMIVT